MKKVKIWNFWTSKKKFGSNLKGQVIFGIIIFIISFAVASIATGFRGMVAAMIILTFGEMFVWPAMPTIAHQLAPKGRAGFYQGIVNSTATGGRMIGPFLGGIFVDLYGMSVLFTILIGFLIVALLLSIVYDRPLKANREKELTPFT